MSITVEAVYEDGVLKPKQALPLGEHEIVRVTIDVQSFVHASYGRLDWKGDAETIQRVALDPEFGIEESP